MYQNLPSTSLLIQTPNIRVCHGNSTTEGVIDTKANIKDQILASPLFLIIICPQQQPLKLETPKNLSIPVKTDNFILNAGSIAAVSLLATAFGPAEWAAKLVVPFLLACTVEGLLLGSAVPSKTAKFIHPLITCSVVANVGAAVFGLVSGWSYKHTLTLYLTKVGLHFLLFGRPLLDIACKHMQSCRKSL